MVRVRGGRNDHSTKYVKNSISRPKNLVASFAHSEKNCAEYSGTNGEGLGKRIVKKAM